ncbi:MAG: M28 family metallopeptidase [Proteobacteria bacterium]|nr:M28 family metallopeptidase [Pseudomonadota bacterium]
MLRAPGRCRPKECFVSIRSVLPAAGALIALSISALSGADPVPDAAPPAAVIAAITRDIRPEQIEASVRTLVSFGTRHTLSDAKDPKRGVGAARRWIRAEFERCSKAAGGRLVVTDDAFVAEPGPRIAAPTEIVNVVATLPGEQPASRDRLIVVSGHYDSMPSDVMDSKSDAPGADDDASGTAAVLAAACAMAKHHFDATLVFMAVAGEEQGLVGATHWANEARRRNADIAAMLDNDIVGSSHAEDGSVEKGRIRLFAEGVPAHAALTDAERQRIATGGENDSPARELARFVRETAAEHVPGFAVDVVYRRDRYLRGGDHIPFLEAGYPAVRFTEAHEDFHHQHQNVRVENGVQYGDLPTYVDPQYTANVARVNAATLAALALAPAAPRGVVIDTVRLENDTTLRWEPNREPDVAGYRVRYRRTTAPDWEVTRDVGNVTQVTLHGVSKDDFLFGVEAVDRDGNHSPATYPAPYRPAR